MKFPEAILERYIRTIQAMETARECCNARFYVELDVLRSQLHDAILRACSKDRSDNEFSLALAEEVERRIGG